MFNKKMIKSKKAMFFELFVVFGMVFVLTWALTNISEKKKQFLGDDGKPLYIGERELGVLNAYQKGENLLLYVDQSAVYSSQQAVYDLGQSGGYYNLDENDKYIGHSLWQTKNKENYPDNKILKSNLKNFLNDNLNIHLKDYSSAYLPQNNYDFLVWEGEKINVTGIATQNAYAVRSYLRATGQRGLRWPSDVENANPYIENCFGFDGEKLNDGIDIKANYGREVLTAQVGDVLEIDNSLGRVLIQNNLGIKTEYRDIDSITVKEGDSVTRDQVIGKVNNKGQFHFSVMDDKSTPGMEINGYVNHIPYFSYTGLETVTDWWLFIPIGHYDEPRKIEYNLKAISCQNHLSSVSYTVKQSFKTEIDYNFSDYNITKDESIWLIEECRNKNDIKDCIRLYTDNLNALNTKLKWHVGACDDAERIFYDFIENYKNCLNSPDNNCKCDFKLDYKDFDYEQNGTYRIKLEKDGTSTITGLMEPSGYNLKEKIENIIPSNHVYYGTTIDTEKLFVYEINYNKNGDYENSVLDRDNTPMDYEYGADKTKLYKTSNKQLVFVAHDNDQYKNLKECSMEKNIFRFCVKNTEEYLFFNNKAKGESNYLNPEIKFALYIATEEPLTEETV